MDAAPVLAARPRRLLLPVPLYVCGEDVRGCPFAEWTVTVNVSGRGVCFRTRHELAVGARLSLSFVVPPHLRHRFRGQEAYGTRAVVLRLEHLEGWPYWQVGARLLEAAFA